MYGFSKTVKVDLRCFLLFWCTLFFSFDCLSKDCTPMEIKINMPVKEIDGSVLEGVSLLSTIIKYKLIVDLFC